jgi:hypothetical protein
LLALAEAATVVDDWRAGDLADVAAAHLVFRAGARAVRAVMGRAA